MRAHLVLFALGAVVGVETACGNSTSPHAGSGVMSGGSSGPSGGASSKSSSGITGGDAAGGSSGVTGGGSAGASSGAAGVSGGSSGGASSGGASNGGAGIGGSTSSGGSGGGGGAACVSPTSSTGMDWGKLFADSVVQNGFGTFDTGSYPVGLFMHGLYKVYKRTMDPKYLAFIASWSERNCGAPSGANVDGIMHMAACADAYELTTNSSLKGGLDSARRIFDSYPKTTDGAFIHEAAVAGQNWGDTSFMALSFIMRYGQVMKDTTTYGIGTTQLSLFSKHLTNPQTGLLFHAYDETGAASWVVPGTHHSPESWGRAMGWYVMATVMVLEAIPANDPGRPAVEQTLKNLVTSLAKFQDKSGTVPGGWWQVVDEGAMAGNWLETSCTAMYSLGTWWAATHGLVDSSYCKVATDGFNYVLSKASTDPTKLLTGVCEGTDVGDYAYYVGRNHAQFNDFHGLGSFVLMWEGMR
jgi:unsaturated rhamnogalacturonyl hydrolase